MQRVEFERVLEGVDGLGKLLGLHVGGAEEVPAVGVLLQERLRDGSYQSIELNTKTAILEWGGQKIYVMAEDDAYLTPDGYKFFQPRQTEFYLISSK